MYYSCRKLNYTVIKIIPFWCLDIALILFLLLHFLTFIKRQNLLHSQFRRALSRMITLMNNDQKINVPKTTKLHFSYKPTSITYRFINIYKNVTLWVHAFPFDTSTHTSAFQLSSCVCVWSRPSGVALISRLQVFLGFGNYGSSMIKCVPSTKASWCI